METSCLSANRVQIIGATCVSDNVLLINSAQTEIVSAKESNNDLRNTATESFIHNALSSRNGIGRNETLSLSTGAAVKWEIQKVTHPVSRAQSIMDETFCSSISRVIITLFHGNNLNLR